MLYYFSYHFIIRSVICHLYILLCLLTHKACQCQLKLLKQSIVSNSSQIFTKIDGPFVIVCIMLSPRRAVLWWWCIDDCYFEWAFTLF